jgi:tetratricopeptide (TPR) repeat protein
MCLRHLAEFAAGRGDKSEARRQWRAAIDLGEVYTKEHPDDVNEIHEIAWACAGFSDFLSESTTASSTECEAVLLRGLRPVEAHLAQEPESIQALDVAAALRIRLGNCLCRQNRIDEAIDLFDKAIGDMESLCEAFPWNENYWGNVRWYHNYLVSSLQNAGQAEKANAKLLKYRDWLQSVAPKLPDEPGPREKLQQNRAELVTLLRSASLEDEAKDLAELNPR